MAKKVLLQLNHPASSEKVEELAAKLAEFLGLEREDVYVLGEGVSASVVEVEVKHKTTHHKKEDHK